MCLTLVASFMFNVVVHAVDPRHASFPSHIKLHSVLQLSHEFPSRGSGRPPETRRLLFLFDPANAFNCTTNTPVLQLTESSCWCSRSQCVILVDRTRTRRVQPEWQFRWMLPTSLLSSISFSQRPSFGSGHTLLAAPRSTVIDRDLPGFLHPPNVPGSRSMPARQTCFFRCPSSSCSISFCPFTCSVSCSQGTHYLVLHRLHYRTRLAALPHFLNLMFCVGLGLLLLLKILHIPDDPQSSDFFLFFVLKLPSTWRRSIDMLPPRVRPYASPALSLVYPSQL